VGPLGPAAGSGSGQGASVATVRSCGCSCSSSGCADGSSASTGEGGAAGPSSVGASSGRGNADATADRNPADTPMASAQRPGLRIRFRRASSERSMRWRVCSHGISAVNALACRGPGLRGWPRMGHRSGFRHRRISSGAEPRRVLRSRPSCLGRSRLLVGPDHLLQSAVVVVVDPIHALRAPVVAARR
jgi:hypothetical protein